MNERDGGRRRNKGWAARWGKRVKENDGRRTRERREREQVKQ